MAAICSLQDISKQYSERLLLDGVSLQINSGDRIGLVGVNGSGKTTLLRLVAGLEPPDQGSVTLWGGVRLQYVPQQPELAGSKSVLDTVFDSSLPQLRLLRDYEWASQQLARQPDHPDWQRRLSQLSDEIGRTGSWAAEAKAKSILTRMGLTDFAAPVATLSGGQQKRVALAQALIDPSDLLILDEPTNHIDADAIAWLEEILVNEPRALLMVTHDRYFLDRVVNRIIELDRRQLINYPGNYSRYLELSSARREQLAEAEMNQQRMLRRELEWLRRGPKARGTKQKARKQRIEEMQQITHDQNHPVSLALAGRRLGKKVLTATSISKWFGSTQVLDRVDFSLEPGDRIGVIGPNGAGKSTFLDILAGKIAADSGQVEWGETVHLGYYDQHGTALDDSLRVIDFIKQEAPLIPTREGGYLSAFQVLEWFLFSKKQQHAQIGTLSGGERRRLYLLYVLMRRPNVLLLDEPTNDLDIQTLTVLEEFMDHFQGSLVVVSHDRYLLDRIADYLVSFEAGQVSARYPTPYSVYRRLYGEAKAKSAGSLAAEPAVTDRPNTPPSSRPRKLSWHEQRELEQLEQRIGPLEEKKLALQVEINACGADYVRLQALAEQLQAIEDELERTTERWLELSEVAEAGNNYP